MTRKEEFHLLNSLENLAKALFSVIGGNEATDWAVDRANGEPTQNPGSDQEELFEQLFRFSQYCHTLKFKYSKEVSIFE